MVGKLPEFYRAWDKQSIVFKFLNAFATTLEEGQKDLFAILRSHWIDTAYTKDLDNLASIFDLKRRRKESDDALEGT